VELQIAPADWKALRYRIVRRSSFLKGRSPKRMRIRGFRPGRHQWHEPGRVEVRKKGYIGSNDTRRPALKLRIPRTNKQKHQAALDGADLNNNRQDPRWSAVTRL